MESRERVDFLRCGGEGKRRNKDLFFCCPLSPFLSRNVDLCQRFFRLTLFQRSFNWRLSFRLLQGGGAGEEKAFPISSNVPENVLVRYMPPVFLEDPLGICQIVSSKSGSFLSRVLSWL